DALAVAFGYGVSALPTVNVAPVFDGPPLATATAGQAYYYDAAAHDPDGTVVGFLLASGPAGMTVNAATGELTWSVPAVVPAAVPVRLLVLDTRGGWSAQEWTIQVTGGNRAPVFETLPHMLEMREGDVRVLQVQATDPDHNALTYWADRLPPGVT